jgi:hypothetical protein
MKYKNIPSMAHNFAHSFLGDMNYVQGEFIFAEVQSILRRQEIVEIDVLQGLITPEAAKTKRLQQALTNYRAWLSQHALNHKVDISKLTQFVMRFSGDSQLFNCDVYVQDDRGKLYQLSVNWWK